MALNTSFPRPDVNLSRLKAAFSPEQYNVLEGAFRALFRNLDDLLKVVAVEVNSAEANISSINGLWTSYTPVVSAQTGAITSYSATGRYKKIGNIVHLVINATIISNGTGINAVNITLPFTAGSVTRQEILGRDTGVTGKSLAGTIASSTSAIQVVNYDNTYPAVNGSVLTITGIYEAA